MHIDGKLYHARCHHCDAEDRLGAFLHNTREGDDYWYCKDCLAKALDRCRDVTAEKPYEAGVICPKCCCERLNWNREGAIPQVSCEQCGFTWMMDGLEPTKRNES